MFNQFYYIFLAVGTFTNFLNKFVTINNFTLSHEETLFLIVNFCGIFSKFLMDVVLLVNF